MLAPEWQELATRVTDGDGLQWAGDPRLELRIGVIEYKGRTGRRLEVWRQNEDGTESPLAHWRPDEQHRVCYDLAQMRLDAPGRVSTEDRIDAHNAKMEKAAVDAYNDKFAEMTEHMSKYLADTTGPRQTFRQIPGFRDKGWKATK